MTFEVIVLDFSRIKGLWETRAKKYKERCKKEEKRIQTSALQKIKQEWSFMLECRNNGIPQSVYLKNGFVDPDLKILEKIERKSHTSSKEKPEKDKFVFKLYGEHWEEFPDSLREQTHLKELHVNNTSIQAIPDYIQTFQKLIVLDMSHNKIRCLPPEIGYLANLKEFNISFNNLQIIPPELGNCENLEKLDLSGNLELTELPFELSSLKKVTFVDVSANKFSSIPICVLRMSSLQWLDISSNKLQDLPQDIDRYIKLLDSLCLEAKEEKEMTQDREYFEKEFMKAYIEDLTERETTPSYTTKVSFNLEI
ncbi:leucine-rich repeat-containing protein 2 isoform X2 [Xenopus laevis]|uniref:Leucine-rich repeat-containing protein 2 isoform X2 n=1 Tax=Xenopus laevis TaxID=8355 RepID=A0A8J1KTD3_XENLA|nr:leucine-rich repeat-containing protein 2 isoform X2 [Xenopus laevis]